MSRPAAPLCRELRWTTVLALGLSAPALLLHLPPLAIAGIVSVGLVAASSALHRPLPRLLRMLLLALVLVALFAGFDFRLGRDAGSALLVAMLLLKLSELRGLDDARRALAYALFLPFAAFLQDQGPLTLALGVLGSCAVLLALARLGRAPATPAGWPQEGRWLLRTLALALPLALVGFWLFPRLATPLWGLPENAVARTGISESMAPGDWIDLLADDSVVFRVRFDGPPPRPETLYWRGPVLENFDGRQWTPWPGRARAPAPQALLPGLGEGIGYTLTMEHTERRFVFALEQASAWPAELQMGSDGSLRSAQAIRNVSRFALRATPFVPYSPLLTAEERAVNLTLPAGSNPRSRALARRWRGESSDELDYLRRVLDWFHATHAYDLAAPPLGRHRADEFLFDTRSGFCEHFSSAFAVLMRAAGIPARVVLGYAGGSPNRIADFWTVRQLDAHAWNEVWLQGRGWVRVDPTAAVAPERIFETLQTRDADLTTVGGAILHAFDFGDALREAWNQLVTGYDAARQLALLRQLGWRQADQGSVVLAFLIAAALALALTLWILLRSSGPRPPPLERAWRRYLAGWARQGLGKQPGETAAGFARRIARVRPEAADGLRELVARREAICYAADPDPAAARQLIRDLEAARAPSLRWR